MRKLEQWWFRYFSYATKDNDDAWVRWLVMFILCVPCTIGCVLNLTHGKGQTWILISFFMLIAFAIPWITVYFYHNYRIRKEQKKK
jgi:uncharacterized membrane protein YhaH (DUF805 family)